MYQFWLTSVLARFSTQIRRKPELWKKGLIEKMIKAEKIFK